MVVLPLLQIWINAFTTPINLICLGWVFFQLFIWWTARKWQSVEMVKKRAIFLNPRPTQILQNHLRSKIMDIITSHVWFWFFVIAILLEMFICGMQGQHAWRFGLPIMVSWMVSMTIQLLVPVVVPIRWEDFGRPNPVETIRFSVFKSSDKANGLLYNGLPSNHLGLMIAGFILCILVALRNPHPFWLFLAAFFVFISVFFSFSVIYLGEHYIHDLIVSCILFPPIVLAVYIFVSILFPW